MKGMGFRHMAKNFRGPMTFLVNLRIREIELTDIDKDVQSLLIKY